MFATLLTRSRLLTAAAVTSALLAGHPTLAQSVGVDVWNVPELKEQLREAAGESARLDAEDDVVRHRIAVKETIVEDLVAGRTTLAEATAKFTDMNATRPAALTVIRMNYPGSTDQEVAARNVIAYALARTPAATQGAVSRRFDADLQQMIAPSGAR